MPATKGNNGLVEVGGSGVGEVRSFSFDQEVDAIEDSSMGDADRTYIASIPTWSGSIEAWWDNADSPGQEDLTIGASVTLSLAPEGSDPGDITYDGTALLTGVGRTLERDGIVEVAFRFQGTGALTRTTQV